ncbi:MAG: CapA family protein [bacterium]
MKIGNHKKYHVSKTALILGAVFLLIFLTFVIAGNFKFERKPKSDAIVYEYEQYYLLASHFTDDVDTMPFSELKDALVRGSGQDMFVSLEEKDNIKRIFGIENYQPKVRFAKDRDIVNTLIDNKNSLAIIPFRAADSRIKTLGIDNKKLWDKSVEGYPLHIKVKTNDKYKSEGAFDKNKLTLLTNIGDVILGRHVAYKMKAYNDYTHPWLKLSGLLSKADITFADLETPLSDRISPPDEGMSFIAPQKSIAGLKLGGVDVVALANNHSTNYGTNVFGDTLDILNKSEIKYVGGGVNSTEAYKPLIIERNGLRWAFVNYNSIIGAINATETSQGVAKFGIKPWAETDSPEDLAMIKKTIIEAKKQADIVVAEFHWGVEYNPNPIQSQIDVAHAAIESGANLVLGTHPHVVQGMENYQNTPILYSLGNFIFDQEWSIETKQGVVAETYFYNKKLVNVSLIPYQIEDYNQPRLTNPTESKIILDRIFGASLSKDYK